MFPLDNFLEDQSQRGALSACFEFTSSLWSLILLASFFFSLFSILQNKRKIKRESYPRVPISGP
jgi:hypothetical protein